MTADPLQAKGSRLMPQRLSRAKGHKNVREGRPGPNESLTAA
jgi:hypothetical protein